MSNITKTAQLPVQYEEAVKALDACLAIDEAKYWSDKADALAAWAKIYRNDVAGRRAKQLKLHAYRRMGTLAAELRPNKHTGTNQGAAPGPLSLLREQGLTESQASVARKLALTSKVKFDAIVDKPNPPSPMSAGKAFLTKGSDAWRLIGVSNGCSMSNFRSAVCRKVKASKLARGLVSDEIEKARVIATECAEWLDEFLQHLPKQKRSK